MSNLNVYQQQKKNVFMDEIDRIVHSNGKSTKKTVNNLWLVLSMITEEKNSLLWPNNRFDFDASWLEKK